MWRCAECGSSRLFPTNEGTSDQVPHKRTPIGPIQSVYSTVQCNLPVRPWSDAQQTVKSKAVSALPSHHHHPVLFFFCFFFVFLSDFPFCQFGRVSARQKWKGLPSTCSPSLDSRLRDHTFLRPGVALAPWAPSRPFTPALARRMHAAVSPCPQRQEKRKNRRNIATGCQMGHGIQCLTPS